MTRDVCGVSQSRLTPNGCWEAHAPLPRPTSSPKWIRHQVRSSPAAPGTEISAAVSLLLIWPDANLLSPPIVRNSLDATGSPDVLPRWKRVAHSAAKQEQP